MTDLSNDLLQSDVDSIDHSRALDAIEPLACDRWVALSAMQKAIRRGDTLTAQRALRTLYQYDPSSAWRRLLIIACEDVGIGALGAVVMTATRCANAKALRETGREAAAVLATAQMLAEAPKDRSADLLFAVALHDPALETMRLRCRSASVARRLEFVADPTLSLPERALAVWHSSGVGSWGEPRVGPGDLGALMRTYAELGVPERLLEALAVAIKKAREPFALLLPLLWLEAVGSETELLDAPLPRVRSDQRRSALRPRQAYAAWASSDRALRARECRDRPVSEGAQLPFWRRRSGAHGGFLCRRRADPADLAMAPFG